MGHCPICQAIWSRGRTTPGAKLVRPSPPRLGLLPSLKHLSEMSNTQTGQAGAKKGVRPCPPRLGLLPKNDEGVCRMGPQLGLSLSTKQGGDAAPRRPISLFPKGQKVTPDKPSTKARCPTAPLRPEPGGLLHFAYSGSFRCVPLSLYPFVVIDVHSDVMCSVKDRVVVLQAAGEIAEGIRPVAIDVACQKDVQMGVSRCPVPSSKQGLVDAQNDDVLVGSWP